MRIKKPEPINKAWMRFCLFGTIFFTLFGLVMLIMAIYLHFKGCCETQSYKNFIMIGLFGSVSLGCLAYCYENDRRLILLEWSQSMTEWKIRNKSKKK